MKRSFVALMLFATPLGAAPGGFATPCERSGFEATPRYAETIDYCKQLARASRWLRYVSFGKSPQGRDLPLLIVDRERSFSPQRLRRQTKVVLMIQACIHAGETDGKDAGLALLRDIAVTKRHLGLLDHVTILFIPIFNVDGHERFGPYNRINQNGPEETGWRATAQNLNLNRDYLKADSPEIKHWLALFNEWRPDFLVDCHTTDGADYQYVLTYILDVFGNMAPSLTRWTRDTYLVALKKSMARAGYEMFPYVYLVDWPNPKGGMRSWVSTPRFSTGYTALRNRPGLVVEAHMIKDYRTRVNATYEMLKQTAVFLNEEYSSLKSAIEEAERFTASRRFREEPFALRFEPDTLHATIDFKGIDYEVTESDLTGGPWYRFNGRPTTFRVPYYNQQNAAVEVDLPEAYIIPPEWQSVIERLRIHGIEFWRLKDRRSIKVDSYRFGGVEWQAAPFEGRHPVTFTLRPIREQRTYPAGSVVVDMSQPAARVVAHILEPGGPDSYVYWGFFDAIFEQKEFAETYVMEEIAREMMANDEALRREFEDKKQKEPGFAKNPRDVLNWFFQRTPYWDDRKDVYPVGKIFDRSRVESLRK